MADDQACTESETHPNQNQPGEPTELKIKTEVSEEKLTTVMQYLKETSTFCLIHTKKEISLFCKTCEKLICTSCIIAGDHTNHIFCETDDVVPTKRKQLFEQMSTREDMTKTVQQNMNMITTQKENVLKKFKYLSVEIDNRKTEKSQILEAWSQTQQALVRTQERRQLRSLDKYLVKQEACLAILEHFRRNPKCDDFIDDKKCVHVLQMLESATGEQTRLVSDVVTFTTEMSEAEKMERWMGHVTGIDSEVRHQRITKFHFCDSQISQISPISAKRAFVVTENHLYLVDSAQVKCTRADIEPLMTKVKYITPVTERGIYVQQTNSDVIKRVTVDGQTRHFTIFDSSPYSQEGNLSISHTGTILLTCVQTNVTYHSRRQVKVTNLVLNEFNKNGVKDESKSICCQYHNECTFFVLTAEAIYTLNTNELPTKLYQPGYVVNVETATKYVGTIGSEPASTFHPRGLCKDQDDHLIVSDFWNHAIHQLTSDGTFNKFLMTEDDGLMYPTAVGIDNINWLWVAQKDGQIHIVKYDP
ncbi:uncharacterized protein LOC117325800 [Pecten maximus]|uniref:uncharacterized protein LOC117325800 n=1 Tax=Pecten maximus TaxID=6579 RepID=UPI0014589E1A|nr:uncharacterized protein LOC117325800 [Pecten maximus]XP_033738169.1 uncharacterized protein LOC117325800 [Pecten maximus]